MKFQVYKEASFEAAHLIEGHVDPFTLEPGKCARLHGHTYTIGICVEAERIDPATGFVIDFAFLGDFLRQVCDQWDHKYLNDLDGFIGKLTTAENIAFSLSRKWYKYRQSLRHDGELSPTDYVDLVYIEVRETPKTFCRLYVE